MPRRREIPLFASAIVVGALFSVAPAMVPASSRQPAPLRWFKGNTHTHTTNSDGDSSPDEVARWYRSHGYNFLVLSDHNVLTSVEALNALQGRDENFLLIKGEEVTDRFEGRPIHVNGLDVAERVEPQHGASVLDVLQRNVDAIRRVRGVPHINHPNFGWAITADDIQQVRNTKLLEIFNGHPLVNNVGGGGVQGLEQAWDAILTAGPLLYGIAVDDAHTFRDPGNPNVAGPGRGWVVARASALEPRAILAALESGDFYASTGVELIDLVVSGRSMRITVREESWAKYRILFIGRGGRVLDEALRSPAEYVFRGDEGYVRAKVLDSSGRVAWVQPVPVNGR